MKIILSAVVALMLLGCSDDNANKQTHATQLEHATPTQQHATQKVAQPRKVSEAPKVVEKELPKETPPAEVKKVVEVEAPKVEVVSKEIATIPNTKEEVKTQTEVKVAPDGKKLYMACAACHGAKGEKSALGKSKVIQGWSVVKIEDALKGYKDGSYGGAMKGIMKGQASKLSDDEIAAVAEYISKLH